MSKKLTTTIIICIIILFVGVLYLLLLPEEVEDRSGLFDSDPETYITADWVDDDEGDSTITLKYFKQGLSGAESLYHEAYAKVFILGKDGNTLLVADVALGSAEVSLERRYLLEGSPDEVLIRTYYSIEYEKDLATIKSTFGTSDPTEDELQYLSKEAFVTSSS